MKHQQRQLPAAELRRRRCCYVTCTESIDNSLPREKSTPSPDQNVAIELLGLYPGEYIQLHNGFHFRVIRGAVELNGHIYTSRNCSYTKVLIPPWEPAERMLALCSGDDTDLTTASIHQRRKDCTKCEDIVVSRLLGGSCCAIKERLSYSDSLMKRHFNITNPRQQPLSSESDPDREALEFYDNKTASKGKYTTVVAFTVHTSAFGSIPIRKIFAQGRRAKIIPPQLLKAATKALEIGGTGGQPPVLMVHGDKGAGKSTSVIYMINYLLNHVPTVALLDTDVGQPIFGQPGTVSLKFVTEPITTPPYALEADHRPEVICLIGDVKVTNPTLTLAHIRHCLDTYTKCVEDDRSIPLIINTFGWVSGMGGKLLDSIAALGKVPLMLRFNTKHVNAMEFPAVATHEEMEKVISDLMTVEEEAQEREKEVTPLYEELMEPQGAQLAWVRHNCTIIDTPSHTQIVALIDCLVEHLARTCPELNCFFERWSQLQAVTYTSEPSANDLRWLRACVLLNPSFRDALHFPPMHQEDFFGAIGGPDFKSVVCNPGLFLTPKQLLLRVENYSLVLQNTVIDNIQEICPVIAGSMIALCKGRSDGSIIDKISQDWEFTAYAYVHYLDAEDMSMLISHSVAEDPEELLKANIAVVCQSVGFDTMPTRLCHITQYPGAISDKCGEGGLLSAGDVSTSQFVPFRRNNLVHMISVQGSGNSAGNSRKNIKRHRFDGIQT